jgi:hypothetical protein
MVVARSVDHDAASKHGNVAVIAVPRVGRCREGTRLQRL